MATFLDIGLLQEFSVIFPILLVFSLVFALLQRVKPLGDSMGINAVIAVTAAFMVLLSETLTQMINFMVPWFVVVFIFFLLLLLIFQIFGATEADFHTVVKDKAVYWAVIGIALVILMAAIGQVLGQSIGPYLDEEGNSNTTISGGSDVATGDFETNVTATLFHPKVLGLMIIFAVAIFAIAFLGS
jgi:hypothetical protein